MIGERSAPRVVGFGPAILLRLAYRFRQQQKKKKITAAHIFHFRKYFYFSPFVFLFFISRGLEHCGPFIRFTSSIKVEKVNVDYLNSIRKS